jgi:modulator of FtsH protease
VQGWESFFAAEAGAAATLAGLLFVAVSINLSRIIGYPGLTGRAAEALLLLFGVLATASLGMIPSQTSAALGIEVLGVALVIWVTMLAIQVSDAFRPEQQRLWIVTRMVSGQLGLLPIIAAGASLVAHAGGGIYWIVPGVLLSLAAAILDAWVLLIEIQR